MRAGRTLAETAVVAWEPPLHPNGAVLHYTLYSRLGEQVCLLLDKNYLFSEENINTSLIRIRTFIWSLFLH